MALEMDSRPVSGKLQDFMTQHFIDFYREKSGISDWNIGYEHNENNPPIDMQIVRDWGDYLVEIGCVYPFNKKYANSGHTPQCLDSEYDKFDHPYYLQYHNCRLIWVPKKLVLKILSLEYLP